MKEKGFKLARFFLFTGILCVSLLVFSYIVRQAEPRKKASLLPAFYAEPKDSLDVITIGSSASYRYFDTPVLYEKFGLTSFNLATPLQPPSTVKFIMEEAEKTQSPELFVVEAREFLHLSEQKKTQAAFCVTDSMNLSLTKWKLVRYLYASPLKWFEEFFDITKYHSSWPYIDRRAFRYWDNTVPKADRLWQNIYTVVPQAVPERQEEPEAIELGAHNLKPLLDLLEDCREKNRRVLFVVTPYSHEQNLPGKIVTLREIVESYGYPLFDMTNEAVVPIDYETDLYNSGHVNVFGAEKVTKALGEYIKKEYNIETQHSEEVTKAWNRYARKNRRAMEARARERKAEERAKRKAEERAKKQAEEKAKKKAEDKADRKADGKPELKTETT